MVTSGLSARRSRRSRDIIASVDLQSFQDIGFLAVVVFLSHLAVPGALWWWGRRIARERPGTFWRRAAAAPLVALALNFAALGVSFVVLVQPLAELSTDADAASRAMVLAETISCALPWGATLSAPAVFIELACLLTFGAASLRSPRRVLES
jgi:hypothetical protein